MKAYVLYGINDIRYEEISEPIPQEGEALIDVKNVGICGSDIPRIFITGAHVSPLIPGHEFSGIVEEVGADRDRRYIGKRVCVYPLIPCGKCRPCLENKYEMCRNYNYIGSRCNGAFAEKVIVPVGNLVEIGEKVSFEQAAMVEPLAVAFHAVKKLIPKRNNTCVIMGLGTIGLLTLSVLAEQFSDMEIYAIGNKDLQNQMATRIGIPQERFFDIRCGNPVEWIMSKTDGLGVNCAFECVGKYKTIEDVISCMAPEGQAIMVGNPSGNISITRDIYWKILRNQLDVKGTWNSFYDGTEDDDWHNVIKRISDGRLFPEKIITHRMLLNELEKGLHIMRDKTEDYVKIMINC